MFRRSTIATLMALPFLLSGCLFPLKAITIRIGPPSSVAFEPDPEVQAYLVDDGLPIEDTAFHNPDAAARFFPQRAIRVPVNVRCGLRSDDGTLANEEVSVIVSIFGIGIHHDEVAVYFEQSGGVVASATCSEATPVLSFTLVLVPGDPVWDENEIEIEAAYSDQARLRETYFPEYEAGFLQSNPLVDSDSLPLVVRREREEEYTPPGM